MKFKFLTGDVNWLDYGAKWISKKLNNGEFDYWLVMELTNMGDACGRDNKGQPKYYVSLSAVSPHEAGHNGVAKACESYGYEDSVKVPTLLQVEALHGYGISAHLWQKGGNNAHAMLREARQQADESIDEALSRAVNKIGTTGLEALRGDITAGLARTIASGSIEGNILAKMHGITPVSPEESLKTATVRYMRQADIRACPFKILIPDHYREDGSCKCDDPKERERMIGPESKGKWGYKKSDFKDILLREDKE